MIRRSYPHFASHNDLAFPLICVKCANWLSRANRPRDKSKKNLTSVAALILDDLPRTHGRAAPGRVIRWLIWAVRRREWWTMADGSRARTRPGGKWSTRPTEESELVLHWATGLTGMIFCLSLPDDWCCLSKLSGATGVCLLLRSARKDRCRLLPRASLRQMPPAICHKLAAWVLILRRKKFFSEDLELSGGQFEVVLQKIKPRTDN